MALPLDKTNNIFVQVGNVALCIALIAAVHPNILFYAISPGLDNSWGIALQLAVKNNLTFGKDIVFTYGPLAYFVTRCPIEFSKLSVYLFDAFVTINVVYILYAPIRKLSILEMLIVVAGLFYSNDLFNFDVVPLLYIVMGYYLIRNMHEQNSLEIFVAAFISLILFFIKLNFGLFSTFVFGLFGIYLFIFHPDLRKKIYLVAFSYIVLFLASVYLLNVQLIDYILNSTEIVRGYSNAMYSPMAGSGDVYFVGAMILIALLCYLFAIQYLSFFKRNYSKFDSIVRKDLSKMLIASFFIASTCFILFKQSFTRADAGHFPSFFKFITPLISLFFLEKNFPLHSNLRKITILLSLAIILFIQSRYNYDLTQQIDRKYHFVKDYYAGLFSREAALSPEANLSKAMRDSIGTRTIDIIPIEVSLAYFNNLNYKPRPVFQSYSAYTEKLDQLNAESYRKESAPALLLFTPGAIDNRYFLWDESKTKLEMLSRYDLIFMERPYFLLEKRKTPIAIETHEGSEIKMKFGEYTSVESTEWLKYARIEVRYNIFGKVRNFLFQPPDLNVTFLLKNGMEVSHRAITNILTGGVLINRYVNANEDDMLSFQLTRGESAIEIDKIKFDSGTRGYFQKEVVMKTTDYYINPPERKTEATPFEAILPTLEDSINFSVDKLVVLPHFVEIKGWAFLKEKANRSQKIKVVLKGTSDAMTTSCFSISRPDITRVFGENKFNLDDTGFGAFFDKRKLKKEETYAVFLCMEDENGKITSSINTKSEIKID